MNQKTENLILIFVGVLFAIALIFAILFGVKLVGVNRLKANEQKDALANQAKVLATECQAKQETTTTKYTADEVFGSFEFSYPKVWSTNVKQGVGGSEELVFMADPKLIVINKDVKGPYPALEVIVYRDKYAIKLKDTENGNRNVRNPMTETDVTVSGIKGKKFTGNDSESNLGFVYVLLPLRDKTLYIRTDDSANNLKKYETILESFKISK